MISGKKRSKSQIIGEKAVNILKELFPEEWVVREYNPDYGIDLAVELFEEYEEKYITTGEHIYFQVKGTEDLKRGKSKIYERQNVEKIYKEGSIYQEIDVVKFSIETSLLSTVERMGSAVPVLLIVVDVINSEAYFVCLNDYIEKIVIPNDSDYANRQSLVINIPITNIIRNMNDVWPIEWYAKRAKLFAFFSKANYQKNELSYMGDKDLPKEILHFANIIRRLDAWSASKYFYALKVVQDELDYFLKTGSTNMANQILKSMEGEEELDEECWETNYSEGKEISFRESQIAMSLRVIWDQMCNCGYILEDLSKEWFLPTYAGLITSTD